LLGLSVLASILCRSGSRAVASRRGSAEVAELHPEAVLEAVASVSGWPSIAFFDPIPPVLVT
jgi:hypothetical protein